jgi:hypothetical protein
MKLTKTEEVKAFKFDDGDGYEFVAARDLCQAKSLIDGNCQDKDSYTVTHMTEKKLKEEIGHNISKNFRKGKKMTAYEALLKGYKKNQLPFIFWTAYLD